MSFTQISILGLFLEKFKAIDPPPKNGSRYSIIFFVSKNGFICFIAFDFLPGYR